MKSVLKSLFVILTVAVVAGNATYAAFTAQAVVNDNSFATGTAGLKLFTNLATNDPLAGAPGQTITGSVFSNIYPNWTQDYKVKLYNSGTVDLVASVTGAYVSDTSDLRNQITVQAIQWFDVNANGVVDGGELGGAYNAPMTLEQWRFNPIPLTEVNAGGVLPLVLRFSTGDLSNAYQNQTTVFDFVFDGTTTGAVQPASTPLPTPNPTIITP